MAHLKSTTKKRTRDTAEGGSHSVTIPFGDDEFRSVDAREAKTFKHGPGRGFFSIDPMSVTKIESNDAWDNAQEWEIEEDLDFALDPDGQMYMDRCQGGVMDEGLPATAKDPVKKKKKKSKVAKRPHCVWKETRRSTYLDEIIRFAGRADFANVTNCPDCVVMKHKEIGPAQYRCCSECFLPDLTCKRCIVRRHKRLPFHRVEKWTGTHFIPVSLSSLGLKVVLNHASMYCPLPIPCHQSMLVFHTNGIHEVDIQYCGCGRGEPQHIQLLRRRLYPSTQLIIKTCVTFELLEHLHKFSLTTKSSLYDFYRALERLTDHTGLKHQRSRYRELFRVFMQWKHLMLLKWGGRAHDPEGPDKTKPGELALQCPSCPIPGVNLREGWELMTPDRRFLNTAFICMDANFRLKNRLVSNYDQNPGLGNGWSYMVERGPYEDYVLNRANDADVSSCVGFQALAQANTRFSQGLRYTGVGGVFCARSEMVMPQGLGNLVKGERYSTMDYIFGSAAQEFKALPNVLISYDIACQWFINLHKRMAEDDWPDAFSIPESTRIIPAVPKLHEAAHEAAEHQVYSLNYIEGVGEVDGEVPERVWGANNELGKSTSGQAPGNREDNIDDNFSFWNYEKIIDLGNTIFRRYRSALANRNIQREGHEGLSSNVGSRLVLKWEAICATWDADRSIPKKAKNPYENPEQAATMSEAEAKKELAEQEQERIKKGGVSYHETPASGFLTAAIEIEDSQRRISRFAKNSVAKATASQAGGLIELRNQLTVRIKAWEALLPIYMPGLQQYLKDTETKSGEPIQLSANPEDHTIWVPSKIPKKHRQHVCIPGLPASEEKLRSAQCHGSLDKLRHVLRIKSRLSKFKAKNIRGQREGTRSRAIIDRVHDRAKTAALRYRHARGAKLALSGPGDWEREYQPLLDDDIRSYDDIKKPKKTEPRKGTLTDAQIEAQEKQTEPTNPTQTEDFNLLPEPRDQRQGTGITTNQLSWIWVGKKQVLEGAEMDAILMAEWAKSRARSKRTEEELLLLKEEMRRILAFLEWKAKWWLSRASLRFNGVDNQIREALNSYATTRSQHLRFLAVKFKGIWSKPLKAFQRERTTTAPSGILLEMDSVVVDGDDDSDDEENEDNAEDEEGENLQDDG